MTKLALVKQQQAAHGRVSLEQLLTLLHPDELDTIDARGKLMRESYRCPFTVLNYDEFRARLMEFWAHYLTAFVGVDLRDHAELGMIKRQAFAFIEQHLGGYKQLLTAERNAITGRDGGFIAIIDTITDAIIKHQTELYVRNVFFELLDPGDYDNRLRLAQELLKKYGPVLFPGEELLPHWILANNVEEFIHAFVNQLHTLRRRRRGLTWTNVTTEAIPTTF